MPSRPRELGIIVGAPVPQTVAIRYIVSARPRAISFRSALACKPAGTREMSQDELLSRMDKSWSTNLKRHLAKLNALLQRSRTLKVINDSEMRFFKMRQHRHDYSIAERQRCEREQDRKQVR